MFNVRYLTFAVLEALSTTIEPKTYTDMADDLGISRATFYNHLKALVSTECVKTYRGDGQGRPNRYQITETGRKALENGYRHSKRP